ncbi:hypothetical protein K440DRAFT_673027 [Wilcoxina mikolae CBS 423.85]|nr:hypothetical protein K440DRAFT_673027 [Wilcoxina mikolae CBS 423.85]
MHILRIFTSALAFGCTTVYATPPKDDVISRIKSLTKTSDTLKDECLNINKANIITAGFKRIVADVTGTTLLLIGEPFPAAEAKPIVEAFAEFVEVHKQLLTVVIEKYKSLGLTFVPFIEPIRLALVALEKAVGAFALALIKLIPTEKETATKQFESLLVAVKLAIDTYSGK